MKEALTDAVRRAIELLPDDWIASGANIGRRTLIYWRYGEYRPSRGPARRLAAFLRRRAEELNEVAEEIEAALGEEADDD